MGREGEPLGVGREVFVVEKGAGELRWWWVIDGKPVPDDTWLYPLTLPENFRDVPDGWSLWEMVTPWCADDETGGITGTGVITLVGDVPDELLP